MNAQGIGTDIVAVQRIAALIDRYGDRFLKRVFTQSEQDYCAAKSNPAEHFAGRFAAKEAIAKAIYQSGHNSVIPLHEIEVINDPEGRPHVHLKRFHHLVCLVSISHERDHAIAMAMLQEG